MAEQGVARRGQGGVRPPPPPILTDQLFNPISTMGGRLCPPHYILRVSYVLHIYAFNTYVRLTAALRKN